MKCKYYKKCKLYDPRSVTCQDRGMYSADAFTMIPATCYYINEHNEEVRHKKESIKFRLRNEDHHL